MANEMLISHYQAIISINDRVNYQFRYSTAWNSFDETWPIVK